MLNAIELENPTQNQLIESLKLGPKYLILNDISKPLDLSVLDQYTNLREVVISDVKDFDYLKSLKNINHLDFIEIGPQARKSLLITSITEGPMNGLKVKVKTNESEMINQFSSFKNFKKLKIAWFTELTHLHLDESFDFLEVLSIEDNFHLQSISGLANLTNLKELQIISCPELNEISKSESTKVENLVIEACPKLNL